MKISISHSPNAIGHHISTEVDADSGEKIQFVETDFDGFPIGSDSLSPPELQYSRTFSQVGSITPSFDHTVKVTATNNKGDTETASTRWTD